MAKRAGLTFFLIVLGFGALCLRLLQLPFTQPVQAKSGNQVIMVDRSRGAIYDRAGRRIVQDEPEFFAVVRPTAAAMQALGAVVSQERLQAAEERLQKGSLVIVQVDTAELPCPDITVLPAFPRYGKTPLAPHIVGYLSGETGRGVSGLEKSFDALLESAAGELRVLQAVDALGRSLGGALPQVQTENYRSRAGIKLTLDLEIQKIAEQAMNMHGLERGAVVVMEITTGEIIAMASNPVFDPNDVAASLQDPAQPFYNRALGAYPVGSTFKCFITAAALEQGFAQNTCFTCAGAMDVGGRVFNCNKREGHGTLDMAQALSTSCNLYFIQLAQQLDAQPLLDLIASFGFGDGSVLAPSLRGAAGNLPGLEDFALPGELANFAFGQGKLLGTPLQMAAATACLAGGGVYRSPKLILASVDARGSETPWVQETRKRQVLRPETAEQLRSMMVATVENGSGRTGKPDIGSAGGKTATAQSGSYSDAGQEILRTGFTGFFPAQSPRYAVTVFCENGTAGSVDCGPVFQRIANAVNARG
ncbi:MAG: penicillin-binding protein 2 [Oscillospiraceae bacterium]|jgi:penicillin-binding protein 2|nr:penicillin-binding protein 2 [Oscillospiraceae bacterium]